MATIYYPGREDCDNIVAQFLKPNGEAAFKTLLVDSGFTGQSCFVLSQDALDLAHATVPAVRTAGALQGMQNRVLVISHMPVLGFQRALIAIMTDTASLSLPSGVEGVAGLRFLRHFARWGAELTTDGGWRFFLSNGEA
jgi:hypothetical protein